MEPIQIKGRPGWYIRYRDLNLPPGKKQRVTVKAGDTKKEAYGKAAAVKGEMDLIKRGLVQPGQIDAAAKAKSPIADLVGQWSESMSGRGRSAKHVQDMTNYVLAIVEWRLPTPSVGGNRTSLKVEDRQQVREASDRNRAMQTLANVTAEAVSHYLQLLGRPPLSRSHRTRNAYLVAIKAFMNYMATCRLVPSPHALAHLKLLNEDREARRDRRSLSFDELANFLSAVDTLKPSNGCRVRTGQWYRAFYLMAARCGGRWSEIARLQWRHFDMAAKTVTFTSDISKTGEAASVPMVPEVIEAILAIRPADAQSDGLVFGGSPTSKTFAAHLAKAGIAHVDQANRMVNLRKTFGSHMIALGVQPREVQLMMRHSQITTTFKHYSDPRMVDLSGVASKLAAMGGSARD